LRLLVFAAAGEEHAGHGDFLAQQVAVLHVGSGSRVLIVAEDELNLALVIYVGIARAVAGDADAGVELQDPDDRRRFVARGGR